VEEFLRTATCWRQPVRSPQLRSQMDQVGAAFRGYVLSATGSSRGCFAERFHRKPPQLRPRRARQATPARRVAQRKR
jgi:hypothetical protein